MNKRNGIYISLCCMGFLILIIDAKTAMEAAKEAVDLCLACVIPALLPFMLLSDRMCNNLQGRSISILRPVCDLTGLPRGAESLWLIGVLGGYPVGAQCINQAYRNGQLSKATGQKMLGYCCNAGPAFIFGVLGSFFKYKWELWALWALHICASVLVSVCLRGEKAEEIQNPPSALPSQDPLSRNIKAMAYVCVWVILFRIILRFLSKWFAWYLHQDLQILLSGIMELTNGCYLLGAVATEGKKFIIAAIILGFGGLCVALQTVSVTKELGLGFYIPGKIMQAAFSGALAYVLQLFLLKPEDRLTIRPLFLLIAAVAVILCAFLLKKVVAFRKEMVYNL